MLLGGGEPPQLALISAVAEQQITEGARVVREPGPAGKQPAAGAHVFWSQVNKRCQKVLLSNSEKLGTVAHACSLSQCLKG